MFLVEGKRTEPKVYKSWLSHLFPHLNFVSKPEEITTNSCRIVPGNGYPNMVSTPKLSGEKSRLEACLLDIKNFNNIDYFFVCVDSEEETYRDRFNDITSRLENFKIKLGMEQFQGTEFYIIVQHRCIETWALGNACLPSYYPRKNISQDFVQLQKYYDILIDDPEQIPYFPPNYSFSTQAKFHEKYLKEYLKEFGFSYSKKQPRIIQSQEFLDALIKRCSSTNHLSSLKHLFDIWEKLKLLRNS
ncbi:hypothetical protein [Synechocystis sp. CS-94]|nr:hypothetical protein [Synechocystis sp. CS-94]MCT0252636.1 hypothetical protein [Synechocystis sp. CS-94]